MAVGFVVFGPIIVLSIAIACGFAYTHWCDLYEAKRLPNRV